MGIYSGEGKRSPFSQRLHVASATPKSAATCFRGKPPLARQAFKRLARNSRAEFKSLDVDAGEPGAPADLNLGVAGCLENGMSGKTDVGI